MPYHEKLTGFFQNGGVPALRAQEFASFFEERDFGRQAFFLKQGQVSNYYLVLDEGFMRSYSTAVDGREVTTAFYKPVTPVFEVASFFQRIASQETIQALTPSHGWVISFEQLNRLFHAHPEFREFGRGILVQSFAAFKTRTLSMITQTAEQRYAALLASNPEVFQHAPLKYIASYLGITDTSLSRIRKEMARLKT